MDDETLFEREVLLFPSNMCRPKFCKNQLFCCFQEKRHVVIFQIL